MLTRILLVAELHSQLFQFLNSEITGDFVETNFIDFVTKMFSWNYIHTTLLTRVIVRNLVEDKEMQQMIADKINEVIGEPKEY